MKKTEQSGKKTQKEEWREREERKSVCVFYGAGTIINKTKAHISPYPPNTLKPISEDSIKAVKQLMMVAKAFVGTHTHTHTHKHTCTHHPQDIIHTKCTHISKYNH